MEIETEIRKPEPGERCSICSAEQGTIQGKTEEERKGSVPAAIIARGELAVCYVHSTILMDARN